MFTFVKYWMFHGLLRLRGDKQTSVLAEVVVTRDDPEESVSRPPVGLRLDFSRTSEEVGHRRNNQNHQSPDSCLVSVPMSYSQNFLMGVLTYVDRGRGGESQVWRVFFKFLIVTWTVS